MYKLEITHGMNENSQIVHVIGNYESNEKAFESLINYVKTEFKMEVVYVREISIKENIKSIDFGRWDYFGRITKI